MVGVYANDGKNVFLCVLAFYGSAGGLYCRDGERVVSSVKKDFLCGEKGVKSLKSA